MQSGLFREHIQEPTDSKLTDSIRHMIDHSKRPILLCRDQLHFEFVPLPHPGKSGRAYWHRAGMKEIEERAIGIRRDKIRQATGST